MPDADQPQEPTLRVLQFDTGREWRGGQQQLLYLSQELADRGYTSEIVTPRNSPLAERAKAVGLAVREISYHGAGDPIAIRAIQQAIQETGAGILHTHTANAHSLGYLISRLPGIPREKKPALLVHRRVDFVPSADPLTRMRYTAEGTLFLCVSEAVRRVLEQYGCHADRLRVVHSCIDTSRIDAHRNEDRWSLRRELGIASDAALIGVIGSFVEHKGHRYLLAALPRILSACPQAHVAFFGDGPLEKDLRRACWEKNLQSRVTFAGFRPDVARFLHCFELLAHPSIEEGLGTTILDAMAAYLPVVASHAGGIPEAVRHGETGWLVPPADPSDLAGAIISLLNDPERRSRFGEAGRCRVESDFSIATLCEKTVSAYQEAMGDKGLIDRSPTSESQQKS